MKNRTINLLLCAVMVSSLLGACVPKSEARMGVMAAKVVAELPEKWPEADLDQAILPDMDQMAATQELRIGLSDFYGVDPVVFNYYTRYIVPTLYLGLTRQDPETKDFLPALAEKWSQSDDQLTWTFTLQSEIAWVFFNPDTEQVEQVVNEDGNPLFVTAEDVRVNILRVLDGENKATDMSMLLYIKNAEEYNSSGDNREDVGVIALDERTLQVNLDKALPALDAIAELPFMAAYPSWLDQSDSDQDREAHYYGYGPYILRDYDVDDTTVLVKNPFWKGLESVPAGILEQISFYHFTSENTLEVFEDNKVDMVASNQAGYEKASEDSKLRRSVRLESGVCAYYLVFKNIEQGPFSDVNNRLAIAHAIDKQKIANEYFGEAAQVLNQFAPPFLRGADYDKPFTGIAFNAEQAFTKLNSQIWPVDDSSVKIFQSSTSKNFKGISNLIIEDVENALDRELDPESPKDEDYYEWLLASEDTGVFIYNMCLDYADAEYFWNFWDTRGNLKSLLGADEQGKAILDLLKQVDQAATVSERMEIYRQLDTALIKEQALVIPLVWLNSVVLMHPNIQGDILPYVQHLENWWIAK